MNRGERNEDSTLDESGLRLARVTRIFPFSGPSLGGVHEMNRPTCKESLGLDAVHRKLFPLGGRGLTMNTSDQ